MQDKHLSESDRNEILQDIIDRMLYLKGNDREKFLYYLDVLTDTYKVNVKVVDGVRIYGVSK
jgi:hypothetical protein